MKISTVLEKIDEHHSKAPRDIILELAKLSDLAKIFGNRLRRHDQCQVQASDQDRRKETPCQIRRPVLAGVAIIVPFHAPKITIKRDSVHDSPPRGYDEKSSNSRKYNVLF